MPMSHISERENETHKGSDGLQSLALDTPYCRGSCHEGSRPLIPFISSLLCWKLSVCKVNFCVSDCRCTEILHLPSSARRLFNEKGKEIFSVKDLQRDELVKT